MMNFAVKSEDSALLGAFEEKLKAKGFKSVFDKKYHNNQKLLMANNIKVYVIDYCYGQGLYNETHECLVFNLPSQWDAATEYLNKINNSSYKKNDWVVLNDGKIVRLIDKYDKIWTSTATHADGIHEDGIERKATRAI